MLSFKNKRSHLTLNTRREDDDKGPRAEVRRRYRPAVRAREGVMLGIRQPLDGPVFEKLEDARNWCIYAMISHFDRRLGMSDATIEPFKGLVDCGPAPHPALVRDIARICEQVAKEIQ